MMTDFQNAIKFLLNKSNTNLNEIEKIVFYEKPFLNLKIIKTYCIFTKGFEQFSKASIWLKEKLFQKRNY